jgi:hypothetical protein
MQVYNGGSDSAIESFLSVVHKNGGSDLISGSASDLHGTAWERLCIGPFAVIAATMCLKVSLTRMPSAGANLLFIY